MALPERGGEGALRGVVGWDIGGAHVKACLMQRGEVLDVAQWACPLWQGMEHLHRVLQAARERWPAMASAQHAVTMTGEMVDLFAHREDGVCRIASELTQALQSMAAPPRPSAPSAVHFFAGDAGWCDADGVAAHWSDIASANWLATARHAALRFGNGVLVDIGSTTTDIIAFKAGRVVTHSRTDAQRLASGELVYHGVVRTPLCALARRIAWRGAPLNVMNEFFATTADVYRLTHELDAAHDLHPSADNAAKDAAATQQRLARMIGLDARDGTVADWLAFARAWRAAQVSELGSQLRRVLAAIEPGPQAVVVSAGCGDFLVADVLASAVAGDASAGDGVTRDAAAGGTLTELGADAAAALWNSESQLQMQSHALPPAQQAPHAVPSARSSPRSSPHPLPGSGSALVPASQSTAHASSSADARAHWQALHLARYGSDVAAVASEAPAGRTAVQAWAQVCAPSVAVATLFDRDRR